MVRLSEEELARANTAVARAIALIPDLPAPATLQASGLGPDLVMQAGLQTPNVSGELTGTELARRLGVLFGVIEPAIEFLKAQRHCEIVGGSMVGASSFRYRISGEGRNVAAAFLSQDHYVGVLPVPLHHYRQ